MFLKNKLFRNIELFLFEVCCVTPSCCCVFSVDRRVMFDRQVDRSIYSPSKQACCVCMPTNNALLGPVSVKKTLFDCQTSGGTEYFR